MTLSPITESTHVGRDTMKHRLTGGCHCTNLTLELELPQAPASYHPRACDCQFCRMHGASYFSDPEGSLTIKVEDAQNFGRYRQGSNTADFLLCRKCGVLIGASYEDGGSIFATINSKAINDPNELAHPVDASPRKLNNEEKTTRWKQLWFSKVKLEEKKKTCS